MNYEINNEFYNKEMLLKMMKHWQQSEFLWKRDIGDFTLKWFDENQSHISIKTSGSTGNPKLIQHEKAKMINSAGMTCNFFKLKKQQSALLCLPVTGIGGMMMMVRAFYQNLNLITIQPNSNPLKEVVKSIDFAAMVPMQVATILEENPLKLKYLNNLIIGGGMLSKDMEQQLLDLEINAYHTFGMTETISHIALRKVGTLNFKTLPGIKIDVDENNCLVIKAPLLLKEPLQTNDIIKKITHRSFQWLGRADNAIETGGFKVLPELVEQKINQYFTNRFFVSSIPDSKFNNKLVLILEGKPYDINLKKLSEVLSKYEIPKEVFFIENFVESNNNKINRKETLQIVLERR